MRLQFRAFDKTGHVVQNVMEAATAADASELLRRQELFVTELAPVNQAAPAAGPRRRARGGSVKNLQVLALFTRQLYSLIRSGTPLTQGLQALERQIKNPRWQEVVADVRARVERGSPLSEAMSAHPDYFDGIYRSMVAAGESSGKLAALLDRLATLTRKRVHTISTIRGAMTYPIVLAFVAVTALTVLLIFVVPRFAELFQNLGAPIPPTTAILVNLSLGLRAYWWAVLPALAGAVMGFRAYIHSAAGKRVMDRVVLRLPQFGKIVKNFATARIIRLLGILTESHLPVQEILRLTRDSTSNARYVALLDKAAETVGHGGSISSAFRDSDLINASAYEVLHSGEQSGQVGPLLLDLADFLDEENEITLKSLTSILEPIMLVFMAVVVGFVAVSIFLPMFDATGLVSGGGQH
jgi:type II secretory pathway component PulF